VAYTLSVGDIVAKTCDFSVIEKNIVRAADLEASEKMIKVIDDARKNLDSVGGIIEAVVHGAPAGLGDPVFDKMEAKISHALMSIGTIKGIEFGSGFKAAQMKGSEHNDCFYLDGDRVRTKSNNAGGILGGITNGEDIVLRVVIKPPSSIATKQKTINTALEATTIEVKGRHDPCICPRVVPVVEAMIAITIVDALLIQKTIQ